MLVTLDGVWRQKTIFHMVTKHGLEMNVPFIFLKVKSVRQACIEHLHLQRLAFAMLDIMGLAI